MSAPASAAARMRSSSASKVSRAMPRSSATPPARLDERGDGIGVRGDDLVRPGRVAGHDEFVAGGEDRDARPAADGERAVTHGGGERDAPRIEPRAGVEKRHRPAVKSSPAGRTNRPRGAASLTTTVSPSRSASSWITTLSAPCRQRRAGEDAHRLAGADGAAEAVARPRSCRSIVSVAGSVATSVRAHRVAIHGGGGEGRLRRAGGKRRGERPPGRIGERNRLGLDRDRDAREHAAPAPRRPGVRLMALLVASRACRRSSRAGGWPRCACRGRRPSPCRRS